MTRRKTLRELTLKDNFMFGAVMCDEKNCKRLLELVLEFPIERVEVSKERSIIYHPEYKGVRLDVYAKDENNTHYNVEMQAVFHRALGKRARYYHSQIDMDLLATGKEYIELPNTYVIFICDFDPFGMKKYRYTYRHLCLESPEAQLEDGYETIFLSTCGENPEEVSKELVKFLAYVRADLDESTADFNDVFVKDLQRAVYEIKQSRRMGERYMLTELLMQDERRAGREEGFAAGRIEGHTEGRIAGHREFVLELLTELGSVPKELQETIIRETDLEQLKHWAKLAARVKSLNQFVAEM